MSGHDPKNILGDAVEIMRVMEPNSIDAIVSDPPYGLEFMGKEWDKLWTKAGTQAQSGRINGLGGMDTWGKRPQYQAGIACQQWHQAWATEALRVLKPGGHLVAFGGERTYHRLACAVEDAGFEIRTMLVWVQGQGFPKSLDIGKAIDKAAGAERKKTGKITSITRPRANRIEKYGWKECGGQSSVYTNSALTVNYETSPATDAAKQWQGWGTALKPAATPILLARKPLSEPNVAANVLKWGTGGLNIDRCRVGTNELLGRTNHVTSRFIDSANGKRVAHARTVTVDNSAGKGRWPANFILSHAEGCEENQCVEGCPVGMFPVTTSGVFSKRKSGSQFLAYARDADVTGCQGGDSGSAARFFYCAKAATKERWFLCKTCGTVAEAIDRPRHKDHDLVYHPTQKPIDLMRWLIRLVTPPGGTVLDPFAGTGTTGQAAFLLRADFIGIEKDEGYMELIQGRTEEETRQQELGL